MSQITIKGGTIKVLLEAMTPRGLDLEQLVLMDGQRVIAHRESPQMAVPGTTPEPAAESSDFADEDVYGPDGYRFELDTQTDDETSVAPAVPPAAQDAPQPADTRDASPDAPEPPVDEWGDRHYPTAKEARAQAAAEAQAELATMDPMEAAAKVVQMSGRRG